MHPMSPYLDLVCVEACFLHSNIEREWNLQEMTSAESGEVIGVTALRKDVGSSYGTLLFL